jgi:hypothetical protein
LPTAFDTKYESILSNEQSLAKAVAVAVIKPNPITVWEVTIPLIFILNYLKFKRAREIFIQNLLFTKKLALEAALDMIKIDQPRNEVLSRIEDKTSSILASDKIGIYSEDIRNRQMKEINLLIDHYCKLLEAEGKDYASLVISAYQTWKDYTTFLAQLKGAEKEVNLAARQTLGTQTAPEIVSMMEEATDRIRMAGAEKIFGTI